MNTIHHTTIITNHYNTTPSHHHHRTGDSTYIKCKKCSKLLPPSSFSSSQRKRPASRGSSCITCVASSLSSPPPITQASKAGGVGVEEAPVELESMMDLAGVSVHLCTNSRSRQETERRREAYKKLLESCSLLARQRSPPAFVGVDCEGNDGQSGSGCLMVQVSSGSTAVVEAMTAGDWISEECMDVMGEERIKKVFCDAKGDVGAINYYMMRDRDGARISEQR